MNFNSVTDAAKGDEDGELHLAYKGICWAILTALNELLTSDTNDGDDDCSQIDDEEVHNLLFHRFTS